MASRLYSVDEVVASMQDLMAIPGPVEDDDGWSEDEFDGYIDDGDDKTANEGSELEQQMSETEAQGERECGGGDSGAGSDTGERESSGGDSGAGSDTGERESGGGDSGAGIPTGERESSSGDSGEGMLTFDSPRRRRSMHTRDIQESDDGAIPTFTATPGCSHLLTDRTPLNFFHLMVSDEMLDNIVRQSCTYADQFIASHELGPRSRIHGWHRQDFNRDELKKFLALIIVMGLINLPQLEDHWVTTWPYCSQTFSKVKSSMAYNTVK